MAHLMVIQASRSPIHEYENLKRKLLLLFITNIRQTKVTAHLKNKIHLVLRQYNER